MKKRASTERATVCPHCKLRHVYHSRCSRRSTHPGDLLDRQDEDRAITRGYRQGQAAAKILELENFRLGGKFREVYAGLTNQQIIAKYEQLHHGHLPRSVRDYLEGKHD